MQSLYTLFLLLHLLLPVLPNDNVVFSHRLLNTEIVIAKDQMTASLFSNLTSSSTLLPTLMQMLLGHRSVDQMCAGEGLSKCFINSSSLFTFWTDIMQLKKVHKMLERAFQGHTRSQALQIFWYVFSLDYLNAFSNLRFFWSHILRFWYNSQRYI